jgi:hypothetical protein
MELGLKHFNYKTKLIPQSIKIKLIKAWLMIEIIFLNILEIIP